MVQKYRNGGQTVAMGANKISYVEGRCVGGGSEINSGLYHRTPPDILETWRKEFQVDGLAEEEMRPHFEACEKDLSVSLLPGPAPAASLKLHDGATRLGWKSLEVPRWFRYDAGSRTPARGKRQSMTETFMPRFLQIGRTTAAADARRDASGRTAGNGPFDARHAPTGAMRITRGDAVYLRRRGANARVAAAQRHHAEHRQLAPAASHGQGRGEISRRP